MANPSKGKGTRLESAFARWWTANVGPCHRLTQHGRDDLGDVGGINVRGLDGIVECKNYKFSQKKKENRGPTSSQLAKWFDETERERSNSCADFAFLVVHKPGCNDRDDTAKSFQDNWCWMTVRTLSLLSGKGRESVDGWVRLTVGEAADLCR